MKENIYNLNLHESISIKVSNFEKTEIVRVPNGFLYRICYSTPDDIDFFKCTQQTFVPFNHNEVEQLNS